MLRRIGSLCRSQRIPLRPHRDSRRHTASWSAPKQLAWRPKRERNREEGADCLHYRVHQLAAVESNEEVGVAHDRFRHHLAPFAILSSISMTDIVHVRSVELFPLPTCQVHGSGARCVTDGAAPGRPWPSARRWSRKRPAKRRRPQPEPSLEPALAPRRGRHGRRTACRWCRTSPTTRHVRT